jgi:phosphoglycolate phosphatase
MKITTILFDLDGTLIDSVKDITILLNNMRNERGMISLPSSKYRKRVSHGAESLITFAFGLTKSSSELVNEFRENYRNFKSSKSIIYPEVENTLSTLKTLGYKLGVCTNKPDFLCENALFYTGLSEYFDIVVAKNDKLKIKPHSDMIDHALLNLKEKPQSTLFVGDSTVDQKACINANIPFVFFSGGYDDGVIKQDAFLTINKINKLLTIDPLFIKNNLIAEGIV